jgi:hypothetical protein
VVWAVQCQAHRAVQGGLPAQAMQRRNAPSRSPSRRFTPESPLDSVVLLANSTTIRVVARLANSDSGVNAGSPIYEMSFNEADCRTAAIGLCCSLC